MMYPWQADQWQLLLHAKSQRRLPHALLFTGIAGTGKAVFAQHFTSSLFCQQLNPDGAPCQHCHSCRLVEGRVHPGVMWIEPEKAGQAIKIDQVREANEFISQTSLQGEYRMVIINPADDMNINAANALLKTLEEPSSGGMLVLISHQGERLPATILSRCQKLVFPRPPKSMALSWIKSQITEQGVNHELLLNLTNGAPLAAQSLVNDDMMNVRESLFQSMYSLGKKQDDPVKSAAKLYQNEPLRLVDFLLSWTLDLLKLHINGGLDVVMNTDFANQLIELKQKTQAPKLNRMLDYLQQLRAQLCAGMNLNKQLMLENVFIRWMGCLA